MFQDLDATLAALITEELKGKFQNVTISFAAPDDQFLQTGVNPPAISLFLYDVRENADLRSNQWEDERQQSGMITRKRAPARVTCSYLITAWASGNNPAQDEHRLLGELTKVLLRHRRIPQNYLKGELAGKTPLLPTRIIADNQLHSLGEFWQALGGKPKATLHYSVTLSVDVFDQTEVGPEVTAEKMDTRIKTLDQAIA